MLKSCSVCKKDKPTSEFYPDRRRKSGLMACCKTCKKEQHRAYLKRNPEYHAKRYRRIHMEERERHLKRKYGITLADYERMFREQAGCCGVCGVKQKRSFDVDHCHETGVVRGLLCTNCNRFIGHAGDDPERLEAAAQYLRKSRKSL